MTCCQCTARPLASGALAPPLLRLLPPVARRRPWRGPATRCPPPKWMPCCFQAALAGRCRRRPCRRSCRRRWGGRAAWAGPLATCQWASAGCCRPRRLHRRWPTSTPRCQCPCQTATRGVAGAVGAAVAGAPAARSCCMTRRLRPWWAAPTPPAAPPLAAAMRAWWRMTSPTTPSACSSAAFHWQTPPVVVAARVVAVAVVVVARATPVPRR